MLAIASQSASIVYFREALLASGHITIELFIVRMIRAHEAVPDIEIEAVVAAEFLMVLDVISRRVEKLSQPRIHEPARMIFIAGVAGDIVDDLPEHEDHESEGMHRHEHHDE